MSVFPKDFLWGVSSSASQSEGGWNEGGRGKSILDVITSADARGNRLITWYDKFSNLHATSTAGFHVPEEGTLEVTDRYSYPNHNGVDFYHRWKEDLELLEKLGINCFCTSISWSRIFPTGEEETPNEEGVAFYRTLFQELRKRKIEPVVTLFWDDAPLAMEIRDDGWNGREIIDAFVRYAKVCMETFGDLVKIWIPIHEINSPIIMFSQRKKLGSSTLEHALRLCHHLILASARVIALGHEMNPEFKMGTSLATVAIYPYSGRPRDVRRASETWQRFMLDPADALLRGYYPSTAQAYWKDGGLDPDVLERDRKEIEKGKADFLSISYFTSHTIQEGAEDERTTYPHTVVNEHVTYSSFMQADDPTGLEILCGTLYGRYEKPIFIMENGWGEEEKPEDGKVEDEQRITYLRGVLRSVADLLKSGVQIMGYSVWSFTDVITEWEGLLKQRYGLVYVNRDDAGNGDFARIPKSSFDWYRKVASSNGEQGIFEEEPSEKTGN